MPIYAYKCSACEHEFDVLQKMSEDPLTVCPKCGAARLAKQLTAAGFQLKGSGWYATDFKNGAAKPEVKPADGKPDDSKPAEAKPVEPAPAAPAATAAAPAAPAASGAGGASS